MYASHSLLNVYMWPTTNELNPFGKTAKPYAAVESVHTNTIDSIIKYNRRLPTKWITNKNMKFAKILRKFSTAAAWSGEIGVLYALKICTINGRIATNRVICNIDNSVTTMANGFMNCLRFNWANFSNIVNGGCVQINFFLIHGTHDLMRSLYCWSEWNSSIASASGIQPRNQRSAFNASLGRFFDSSHNGDSGT